MDGVPFLFNFSSCIPTETRKPQNVKISERKNPDSTNCRGFTQIES